VKTRHTHRIFALLLLLIIIVPSIIQTVHAFENHEHTVCTATDVKHIHSQDIDCSVFHFQIQQYSFDFSTNYEFVNFLVTIQKFNNYTPSEYHTYLISKSSRGPPYFIV
jgi:hypothetical protein